jgi:hypothetical protein
VEDPFSPALFAKKIAYILHLMADVIPASASRTAGWR